MIHEVSTPWFLGAPEIIDSLSSNLTQGLSTREASHRLSIHGSNELPQQPPTPFLKLILKQFEDLLVIILLIAAVTSFILALFEDNEDERLTAFVEPVVILLILIANAAVGVTQESNAENAIK